MPAFISIVECLGLEDVYSLYFTSKVLQDKMEQCFSYSKYWRTIDFDMDHIDRTLLNFVTLHAHRVQKLSFRGGSTMCESCCEFVPEMLSRMENMEHLHLGGNRYIDDGFFLVHMPHLRELNVSSCSNIDGESLARILGSGHFTKLRKITMVNVPHINRWQLQQICQGLPALEYFDATNSAEMTFSNVRTIFTCCCQLLWFTCEPMKAIDHLPHWEEVVIAFKRVALGHSFLRQFPHRGRYMLAQRLFNAE